MRMPLADFSLVMLLAGARHDPAPDRPRPLHVVQEREQVARDYERAGQVLAVGEAAGEAAGARHVQRAARLPDARRFQQREGRLPDARRCAYERYTVS